MPNARPPSMTLLLADGSPDRKLVRIWPSLGSKSTAFLDKVQCLLFVGHEVRAPMARHDNGTACVSHPGGFVIVPVFHEAVDETGRESIAGPKHVIHLDRK